MPHQLTWKYIRNNLRLVFTIIAYLFVNTALFIYNALSYKDLGVAVMIARGCGMCLNFNCTFILVLMLRKCLTWLRSTPMGPNLPLDHNIELHKIIGIFIAIFGGVHTAAHYVNLGKTCCLFCNLPICMQPSDFLNLIRHGIVEWKARISITIKSDIRVFDEMTTLTSLKTKSKLTF